MREHNRSVRAGGENLDGGSQQVRRWEAASRESLPPATESVLLQMPKLVKLVAGTSSALRFYKQQRSPQSRRHSPLGPDEEEEVKEGRVLRAKVALMCCVQE